MRKAVEASATFWTLCDELIAMEASARHDYQAYMALGADEPRPAYGRSRQEKREKKREQLKSIIMRREDYLLVDFLKRVTHVNGHL
jgi:hypothetical protein